jgi:hypothetical protein
MFCGNKPGLRSPRPYREYGELVVEVDCDLAPNAITASKIVIKNFVYLIIMLVV